MNFKCSTFFIFSLLILCEGKSQSRIRITIPSAASEAEYIWETLQDIAFFEENKYQVSLPQGIFFEELTDKARSKKLTIEDYEQLKAVFKDSIYNKADYLKGYEKIEKERALITTMINEISQSAYHWGFKEFKTYQIKLTLYGPGGSYNTEEGTIVLYTTANGKFKNYDNPANTIIHEITHIGIEEAISTKYHVPHNLKERLVDTFVFLNFNQYLPDYQLQDMGEIRPDQYLKTKRDLKKLNTIVEMIMKEKP